MGRRALASLALVSVVGLALSAAACSSVPDVTYSDDAGGEGDGAFGFGDAEGGGDAGGDATTDGPSGCVKTGPEICDDGIDNDCNGRTDCADLACGPTHVCVERAPAGFELRAVSDTRAAACANGYTGQADLVIVQGASPSCACTCTESGGSCTSATVSVTSSTDSSCTSGTTRALNRVQATCAAIPGGSMPVGANNQKFEAAAPATAPTSCAPGSTLTLPTELSGRACTPPAAPNAGGCASTQACVRRPQTGYAICAVRPAVAPGTPATCAGGYTIRRRAGTSLTSTPTCNEAACTCNNLPCGGSVTIYESALCATTQDKFEAITAGASGTTCKAMDSPGGAWTALAYRATATGGCSPSGTATVSGSLDLADETTICCK